MRGCAIVGGGMLGMGLALECVRAGLDVTIFEAEPQCGGLASPWRVGSVQWDKFYHVILPGDTHTRALLRELGLERGLRFKRATSAFYIDRTLRPFSSAFDYLRFPLSPFEKLRLAGGMARTRAHHDASALESISLEQWLRDVCGNAVFERVWLPLLRAKLGESYRDASAAFIWATFKRLYGGDGRIGYVTGGYATILEQLRSKLQSLGIRIVSGTRVEQLESDGNRVHVRYRNVVETFERAALTLAPPLAARLCEWLSADERRQWDTLVYQGVICTSLLLDKPLGGAYVTNIADERTKLTGLIEMSALVEPCELGGRGLLYAPRYVRTGSPEFASSDEEIAARTIADIERIDTRFDCSRVLAARVARAPYVFAIPTIGYSATMPRTVTSAPNVFLCSAAQLPFGTLNVNDTLDLAKRSAAVVCAPFAMAKSEAMDAVR